MKILVAILVCHRYVSVAHPGWDWINREKHRSNPNDQIAACRETWVRDLGAHSDVDVRFFYGRGASRLPLPDEVFLDVNDDYVSLPYKTRGMCAWSAKHGYDFVLKTDDDTYIWANNLMSSGFENHDYTGSVNDVVPHRPYATGLAYWLSAKAVKLVASATVTNVLEDHWVGTVLRRARVAPKHDQRYISIGKTFVGVEQMPRQPGLVAVHPCCPAMIRAYASS